MTALLAQAEAIVAALRSMDDIFGSSTEAFGCGAGAGEIAAVAQARAALSHADAFMEGLRQQEKQEADEETIKRAFAKWAGVTWADGYTLSPSLTQQYLAWRYAWLTRAPQPAASLLAVEERKRLVEAVADVMPLSHLTVRAECADMAIAEVERCCILMPRREG